jgi:hypothetical protein
MKIYFLLFCCILPAAIVHAEQICKPDSIPASTPDSQFIDNGDGTVTDSATGLMWKKCLEGLSGNNCEGVEDSFTWQQALQKPDAVNNAGGFAGHNDWRLPNINELVSLVEEQCSLPAINLNLFPNTPSWYVWSGSPHAHNSIAWIVNFLDGTSGGYSRNISYPAVRLVRGGQ